MRHPARFFPLFLCSLLLFTSCFFSVALGDDDPSVAVVSISGYDNLMEHAAAIGEIVGFPNAQQMIQLQLMQLTGGKPLAGLDKNQTDRCRYQVRASRALRDCLSSSYGSRETSRLNASNIGKGLKM